MNRSQTIPLGECMMDPSHLLRTLPRCLSPGDRVFLPGPFAAYYESPDGRVSSAMGTSLHGIVLAIHAVDDEGVSVVNEDGAVAFHPYPASGDAGLLKVIA